MKQDTFGMLRIRFCLLATTASLLLLCSTFLLASSASAQEGPPDPLTPSPRVVTQGDYERKPGSYPPFPGEIEFRGRLYYPQNLNTGAPFP